jgi:hypothetical protein
VGVEESRPEPPQAVNEKQVATRTESISAAGRSDVRAGAAATAGLKPETEALAHIIIVLATFVEEETRRVLLKQRLEASSVTFVTNVSTAIVQKRDRKTGG